MVAVATEGLPVPQTLGPSSAPRRALLCGLIALAVACTDAGADEDPVAAPVSPSPVETSASASPSAPPPSPVPPPGTEDPSLPPPATASRSPTPTASPTSTETFAPTDDPPPELMLIGEDFDAVIRSYHAYRDWVFMHPDPDRLDAIMHPECECIIQKDLLAHYVDQGQWWVAEPTVVHSVEVVDDVAPNVVILRITLEHTDTQQLIDSEGTVHEVLEPRPPWVEENVYVRDDETSPWRLRSFLDLGSVEDQVGD